MLKKTSVVLLAVLFASIAAIAAIAGDLIIPKANIVPPGADVPADFRGFSGMWKGRWSSWQCSPEDGLDAVLAVEQINASGEVECYYSWGNAVGWTVSPGQSKFKAKLIRENGRVALTWLSRGGTPFRFWLEEGKLRGKKGGDNSTFKVTMSRFL